MAITDKEKGVWGVDQVYNKLNQGSIWEYNAPGDPGQLWMFGSNAHGQLGQNQAQSGLSGASSPIQIPGIWRSLTRDNSTDYGFAATNTDGELWMWGRNTNGEFGQNNRIAYSSPVQVPGTWSDNFALGYNHSAMVNTDGELWMSGMNNDGTLAQNNRIYYSSPVQVPGTWNTTKGTLTNDAYGTGTIKTDGTLWVWGWGGHGQLAQNNTVHYSSPVQVPGTTWAKISGSNLAKFGIKTDGTLWSWGSNSNGNLGHNQGPAGNKSSPTQIPGTTWSSVESGEAKATAAIKTDGTLWVWGSNFEGLLGQNNKTPVGRVSSPVQIPGTTWSKISIAQSNMTAIKTDGTMWAWGNAVGGGLGQNSMTQYSSPIQVGTDTNWDYVASSYSAKAALKEV